MNLGSYYKKYMKLWCVLDAGINQQISIGFNRKIYF